MPKDIFYLANMLATEDLPQNLQNGKSNGMYNNESNGKQQSSLQEIEDKRVDKSDFIREVNEIFEIANKKEQHLEKKIEELEGIILGAKEVLGRDDMGIRDLGQVKYEDLSEEHLTEYANQIKN